MIPSAQCAGYGPRGFPSWGIPPDSDLLFEIEALQSRGSNQAYGMWEFPTIRGPDIDDKIIWLLYKNTQEVGPELSWKQPYVREAQIVMDKV